MFLTALVLLLPFYQHVLAEVVEYTDIIKKHEFKFDGLRELWEKTSSNLSRLTMDISGSQFDHLSFDIISSNSTQKNEDLVNGTSYVNDSSIEWEPYIIGGHPASSQNYPFFASVTASYNHDYVCGAALVAPDILITAAHCSIVFDQGAIVGSAVLATVTAGSVQVTVVKKVMHPNFIRFPRYDVMIMKISPAIETIEPVKMSFDPKLPKLGEKLTVIGFGITSNKGHYSQKLMKAKVNEVPGQTCMKYIDIMDPSQHLCVWNENPKRLTCRGDSGGPVLGFRTNGASQTMLMYGTDSFGFDVCTEAPSVYTRLSAYSTFIQQAICNVSAYPPGYIDCNSIGNSVGNSCDKLQDKANLCFSTKLTHKQTIKCINCVNGGFDYHSCSSDSDFLCSQPQRCKCLSCSATFTDYISCAYCNKEVNCKGKKKKR